MNIIDFVIIGLLALVSAIIIYRKISGKSGGCSRITDQCRKCRKNRRDE